MIQFTEDGQEYWFNANEKESNYDGDSEEMRSILDNIESLAYTLKAPDEVIDGDDTGMSTPEERVYDPSEAESIVKGAVRSIDGFSLMEKGKPQIIDRNRIVTGSLKRKKYQKLAKFGYKQDPPESAEHLPPDEDPPESAITFEGPRGGTYYVEPQDLADELGDDVSLEDVMEELGDDSFGSGAVDSEAASDKIPPEDREVPEGVSGPIESWDPDDVEEIVSPNMRFAEIGSDAHPLFYRRPEPDELDEYVESVRQNEEWSEGQEGFDKGFFGDQNTKAYHSDEDGNWDEERLEKHDEWTENLVNPDAEVPEGEEPVGMLVLGPPGAGKGWWQEQVESGEYGDDLGGREFTHVNSDETKEPIPEYTGTNASEVHEEASKMAKENLVDKTVNRNQNMILDKVATTPDSTIKTMEKMEEKGYDMRATFIDVPEEKAAHNAVSRFFQEGRFTPFDYLLEGGPDEGDSARDGSKKSFEAVLDEFDIPEEKIGEFSNDVEWGNEPDVEELGEDLLKTLYDFFGFDFARKFMR